MATAILISAWLAGAVGGLHCISMCGGFMAALATRDGPGSAVPLLPVRTIAWQQLGYHAGRVTTYMLLGAVFGAAGTVVLNTALLAPLQQAMYVAANILLLLLGLSLVTGVGAGAFLQRVGASAFVAALPILRPVLRGRGLASRVTLGLVWGLVPCGLVYGVLPLALFAGGAWQGAAVMLAFGAGTLPNLLATDFVLRRVRPLLKNPAWRFGAAALVMTFAIAGFYRAMFDPGAAALGAFCLLP